jgi:16S rRNA (adenine1518-N6/adenine1519-N6)-dimethyltransferase
MDADMIEILEQEFRREKLEGRLSLIYGDILSDTVLKNLTSNVYALSSGYKLVANIPYYITGEIIRTFLQTTENLVQPSSMTLLVQKEVALRVARDPKESVLSLSVKAYGAPYYVATVPAGAFSPPPNVDSAILHIADISKNLFIQYLVSEKDFFSLVKTGLGSKRKMLFGLLTKKWPLTAVESAFNTLRIDTRIRGEDLKVNAWFQLTHLLR